MLRPRPDSLHPAWTQAGWGHCGACPPPGELGTEHRAGRTQQPGRSLRQTLNLTAQAVCAESAGQARLVPTACAAARSELRGNAPRGSLAPLAEARGPHTTRLPTGLGLLFPGEGPWPQPRVPDSSRVQTASRNCFLLRTSLWSRGRGQTWNSAW
uniref:Uncharacterized protein n=1 Tax=Pipistrellus kuhlii TaxID=59472 RepID=A0A7J7RGF3_PIPKU|nr:hypothetical protein mPipKuh1_010550 [Pipistrellus kuhlii]